MVLAIIARSVDYFFFSFHEGKPALMIISVMALMDFAFLPISIDCMDRSKLPSRDS